MDRVGAYRSYAAECVALASQATSPERTLFLEMPAGWHELSVLLADYYAKEGLKPPDRPRKQRSEDGA